MTEKRLYNWRITRNDIIQGTTEDGKYFTGEVEDIMKDAQDVLVVQVDGESYILTKEGSDER